MFGATPDRPAVAVLKGVILPLALIPAAAVGFVMKPMPHWLAVAGAGAIGAVIGVRRLMAGSYWYQL